MARNRYEQLIERIFLAHYKRGSTEVTFEREEIPAMAKRLGIEPPAVFNPPSTFQGGAGTKQPTRSR